MKGSNYTSIFSGYVPVTTIPIVDMKIKGRFLPIISVLFGVIIGIILNIFLSDLVLSMGIAFMITFGFSYYYSTTDENTGRTLFQDQWYQLRNYKKVFVEDSIYFLSKPHYVKPLKIYILDRS